MSTRIERLRAFGITEADYEELFNRGQGVCWICDKPEHIPNRRLAVDHDHATGQVRGLLCTRCNQVLGRVRDDAKLLRRAAEYLDLAGDALVAEFVDACRECRDRDLSQRLYCEPVAIHETDGATTTFRYQCNLGHRWLRGFRTVGMDARFRR